MNNRAGKGYGAQWIRQALRQKGVTDTDDVLGEIDWDEQIFRVYVRKYRDSKVPAGIPEQASRQRFLLGRGFTGDQIRRLFRKLKDSGDE